MSTSIDDRYPGLSALFDYRPAMWAPLLQGGAALQDLIDDVVPDPLCTGGNLDADSPLPSGSAVSGRIVR
jgi:hypothetical protein